MLYINTNFNKIKITFLLFVGEEHINVFQKSPFGDKIIQDFSPIELKLIIPNKTYEKCIETRHDIKEIIDEYDQTNNFETVSPRTKKYVSQLTQLPSPIKTKQSIKYEKFLETVMKQKKLLAQKRLKISCLIKQNANSKKNKKHWVQVL